MAGVGRRCGAAAASCWVSSARVALGQVCSAMYGGRSCGEENSSGLGGWQSC